jgi:hypothetical protein
MAYKPKNKQKQEIKKEIEVEINSISDKISKLENLPDARKHQIVSFIKSGIRIVGYCFLPFSLETAAIVLIFSEAIGIYEELV